VGASWAERLTDGELDALGHHDFSSVWLDPIRVSDSWRVDFADANESIARAKFPRLQRLADEIFAARHFAGRADPPDDANPKLGWVIPKSCFSRRCGQTRTATRRDEPAGRCRSTRRRAAASG
jgi:hypothetical protein